MRSMRTLPNMWWKAEKAKVSQVSWKFNRMKSEDLMTQANLVPYNHTCCASLVSQLDNSGWSMS